MLEWRSIKKCLFSPTRSHTSKEGSKPQTKKLNCLSECWIRLLPFVLQWLRVCNAKHTHVRARGHTHVHALTHTHGRTEANGLLSFELLLIRKIRNTKLQDFSSSQAALNTYLPHGPQSEAFLPIRYVRCRKTKNEFQVMGFLNTAVVYNMFTSV